MPSSLRSRGLCSLCRPSNDHTDATSTYGGGALNGLGQARPRASAAATHVTPPSAVPSRAPRTFAPSGALRHGALALVRHDLRRAFDVLSIGRRSRVAILVSTDGFAKSDKRIRACPCVWSRLSVFRPLTVPSTITISSTVRPYPTPLRSGAFLRSELVDQRVDLALSGFDLARVQLAAGRHARRAPLVIYGSPALSSHSPPSSVIAFCSTEAEFASAFTSSGNDLVSRIESTPPWETMLGTPKLTSRKPYSPLKTADTVSTLLSLRKIASTILTSARPTAKYVAPL
jgi:hypothetical protein